MNSKDFYNEISGIYEKMIDFEKKLKLRVDAYKNIFPENGKVIDIGSGIGMDSVALALNGHEVVSCDISPYMIEQVNRNAAKYNVNINTEVNSFDTIGINYFGKFNYVVSVGNTIAHLKPGELNKAIKKIYRLLKPGGKIFLHILNYDLIIKESKRINNIANREGMIIIRFCDFGKKDIDFNILSFPAKNPKDFKIITTKHYPHSAQNIRSKLKEIGFIKIKVSKNFSGDKFNVRDSKDLFIEAVKKL
jgi:SAM-dependent methyltransferase